jgi:hypothetical protein
LSAFINGSTTFGAGFFGDRGLFELAFFGGLAALFGFVSLFGFAALFGFVITPEPASGGMVPRNRLMVRDCERVAPRPSGRRSQARRVNRRQSRP